MFSKFASKVVQEDVPLATKCWLRIGGNARFFAEVGDLQTLQDLVGTAAANQIPVRVLGGGSNLLIRSGQIDALVIQLVGDFLAVQTNGERIVAGAAAPLGDVVSESAQAGLLGLEHLAGIPGTLGGAVFGNSGVKNDDIGSKVECVRGVALDGSTVEISRDALQFGYRRSNLEGVVITEAELALVKAPAEEVTRRLQASWIVKKSSQPSPGIRAALAFIEPSGSQMSSLLEAAGMRSASEGNANMMSQYPGFITVNEEATADSVIALTTRISNAVEVQSGIRLQPQLKIW